MLNKLFFGNLLMIGKNMRGRVIDKVFHLKKKQLTFYHNYFENAESRKKFFTTLKIYVS